LARNISSVLAQITLTVYLLYTTASYINTSSEKTSVSCVPV